MFWTYAFFVIVLPSAAIACAARNARRSPGHFIVWSILCAFGIVIPILIFFLSVFLIPEAKDECRNGWIDCFFTGKLALTPLVFWAAWGLFDFHSRETQVCKPAAQGLLLGALVSLVCLGLGFVSYPKDMAPWMLIPLYVAAWYTTAAICAVRFAKLKWVDYFTALGSSIPFWIGSILWSRHCYETLPNTAPSCFVVTAAARGHRRIVGPFFPAIRRGALRTVNEQLLTFWRFETVWQACSPRTHLAFRSIYNRIGPVIAKRICSPWLADAVYLTLKPVEFFCRVLINIAVLHHDLIEHQKQGVTS